MFLREKFSQISMPERNFYQINSRICLYCLDRLVEAGLSRQVRLASPPHERALFLSGVQRMGFRVCVSMHTTVERHTRTKGGSRLALRDPCLHTVNRSIDHVPHGAKTPLNEEPHGDSAPMSAWGAQMNTVGRPDGAQEQQCQSNGHDP